MPLILCLNELSCEHRLAPARVDEVMRRFGAVLRESRRVRPGAVLITPLTLPDIELAPGYPMARWAADNRNRDVWRSIRRMQDRVPSTFDELMPPNERQDSDYLYEGRHALGLGVAHSCGGLAISLPTHVAWSEPEISLTKIWIDEDDEEVCVRHASCVDHIVGHKSWLVQSSLDDIETGRDLWEARLEHFSLLTFLPRVEADMVRLPPVWVRPVLNRLAEIQAAISDWDPSTGHQPGWRSKVTPEHEQRRRLCEFVDADGQTRIFDLHARFTPDEGRLYFRLVAADRTARIAYVGRKLGI